MVTCGDHGDRIVYSLFVGISLISFICYYFSVWFLLFEYIVLPLLHMFLNIILSFVVRLLYS